MKGISIITICFNNLAELKETCLSVDGQELYPSEHIIIDGSTQSDIRDYLENVIQPSYRKWLCEPDMGISDAFNKGIHLATGEIINLLNSGDQLYDQSVLKKVKKVFEEDNSLKWCHGSLYLIRAGVLMTIGKPFEKEKLYRGMRALHPTMYVKRILYDKYGLFKNELKMAMDYDFLCRIAMEKNAFIDYPLAIFNTNGISSKNYLNAMKEAYEQYRNYYGYSLKQVLWAYRQTLLHYLLRTKLGQGICRVQWKIIKKNRKYKNSLI